MSINVYPPVEQEITLPLVVAQGGTGAIDASAARSNLGCGTMATQNANAVVITGGSATGLSAVGVTGTVEAAKFQVPNTVGNNVAALIGLVQAIGGSERYNLYCTGDAPNWLQGKVGMGTPPGADGLTMLYARGSNSGMLIKPSADTGPGATMYFLNAAGAGVGSITTTSSATSYATSSDVRLKHHIAPLTGSLDLMRRLNPISHLWNADGKYGEGFLAHELQRELAYAVTGEPDEINADGSVKPQQVDLSKCVPRLVGAMKELLAQVEALTTRIKELETALGI